MEMHVKQLTFQSAGVEQALTGWIYAPSARLQGVVVICHGMQEHMGRYHPFMRFLAQNGFVSAGVDQLGHGQSVQGHLPGYFAPENGWRYMVENQRKLVRIVQNEFPGEPVFLLGHSMGSFIARLYGAKYGGDLSGLLLSGTGLYGWLAKYAAARVALAVRRHGGEYVDKELTRRIFSHLNSSFGKNAPPNAWLNRDEEALREVAKDPLCIQVEMTIGGWADIYTLMNMCSQPKCFAQTPADLPVLLFSGDADPVGRKGKDVQAIAGAYSKAGLEDVSVILYTGARHECLLDVNREQVYKDVLEWLNNHR